MKKILIIDDDPDIRSYLEILLEDEFQLEYHFASNGKEGIEKTKKFEFSVITCDQEMPIMLGSEFITRLRQDDSNANVQTPIIFISAHIPDLDDEILADEFMYFINKPVVREKYIYYVQLALFGKEA